MSIKKYLKNIKEKEVAPGPFAARLKYDLKEHFFREKRSVWVPALGYAIALFFFLTTAILLFNPNLAQNINYALSNDKIEQDERRYDPTPQTTRNKGFFYANELEKLPSGKSYIIKRVDDQKNGKVFYIDDVQQKNQPKIVY